MYRTTLCQIDLNAIRHNVRVLLARLAPGAKLCAVVKADAYGHGAVPVARAALEAGARALAVAIPEEGVELRETGVEAPILVLGAMEPQAARAIVEYGLTQTVFEAESVRALGEAAAALGRPARVHIKFDTGMNRIGLSDERAARALTGLIDSLPGVELTGCFTHMATADGEDGAGTRAQQARFEVLCAAVATVHPGEITRHAANTASIFRYPQLHYDMARGGIAIYGYPPVPEARGLLPAMRWSARAVRVKEIAPGERVGYGGAFTARRPTRVMTVAVGYADGYRRALSGKACVLVRGRRAAVIGRVCMDQIMADVTDVPGAAAGDEVVLLGAQGTQTVSAEEMAGWLDTISYEVLCSPSRRVPRVYVGA